MSGFEEVAAVAAVVGTAVSAASAISSGNQQEAAAKYNATVAQNQAEEAEQQGQAQAAIDKQASTRKIGEEAADFAAGGVDPTQGSPLSVMSDSATQGELTQQLDIYRGNVQATGYQNTAQMLNYQAPNYLTAAYGTAGSTLLTGGAKFAQAEYSIYGSGSSAANNAKSAYASAP